MQAAGSAGFTEKGKKLPKEKKPAERKSKGKSDRSTDDDGNEEQKEIFKKEKAASTLPDKTEDAYDPYYYREEEQMGHLSNLMAWAHLVKCSLGTGILTMPKGFAHAGMIPGLFFGFGFGGFCLWCMHILIRTCVHIAARERQPYIPFIQTTKCAFQRGYPPCQPVTKCIKAFMDFVIVGYHFGVCVTYVNYMAQSTLTVVGFGDHAEGYNWYVAASTFGWVPFLCALAMIRNLKLLAPVSMVGNVLMGASMGIVLYFILSPEDDGRFFAGDWQLVGQLKTMPLYIGIILSAVEAFGVVIAVERDMKHPRKFLGWFGVFNQAMFLVLGWYLFLGITGYMKYGKTVKSTVSLTIPKSVAAIVMQVMLALALFCSYPLHLFVCVDSLWTQRWVVSMKDPEKFGNVLYERIFRCVAVLISSILAFAVPQLDLLVSLIGAICLSVLGIIIPGILEFNVAWSKYGNQWSATMVKDMVIVSLGGMAFMVGTYGALYIMIDPSVDD